MNKKELINEIAESASISKQEAGKALDAFMQAISDSMKSGDKVQITGFGTFSVANRAARTARNPQTGKQMQIPAAKVVKFKAGSLLAEQVN